MSENKNFMDRLAQDLQERSKELNCIYQIEEILSNLKDDTLDEIMIQIAYVIPSGFQYPEQCEAKVTIDNVIFKSSDFEETSWCFSVDIIAQEMVVGAITVYYTEEIPRHDNGPFLKEEIKLLHSIAERLGHFVMHQRLKQVIEKLQSTDRTMHTPGRGEWPVILELLRQTDSNLYLSVSRKILNFLCWSGIQEAEKLIQTFSPEDVTYDDGDPETWNQPRRRNVHDFPVDFSSAAFAVATKYLSDHEIVRLLQKWIQEDRLSFLVQVVNRNLSLSAVADAIRKYYDLVADDPEASSPNKRGIQVSLIRRFLSDQLQYINVAKNFIGIRDFYHLLQKVIFSTESHGKLGGKSAGMYLAAQILKKKAKDNSLLRDVRTPKTWYISSDVLLHFMTYNDFEEVVEQKYKEINQVRLEYPAVVQTFKRARFPADIIQGLSVALDDFGEHPLIVRSSSLLEDRMGAAFSGKYKSLFLANQGSKQQRLEALLDGIAEVYASTFSPDPIEYRAERGLIDFGEEMGIMIQEVVGSRVGKYFMPAYAGVAFSRNEFRWSPRIKREDGLVRLVPGLGTRAVDRLSDDYPVLLAPGQPGLRVNIDPEEVVRYSPKKMDVIDVESNSFKSIEISDFLKEFGFELPGINNIVSIYKDGHISKPIAMSVDFDKEQLVANFEGLISGTQFVKKMELILKTLEETLNTPVDIEFASDGQYFYILQCRPQSYSEESRPAPIPKDVPQKQIIFTAEKYISNGRVPDITHIVYVDPENYGLLNERDDMLAVGQAVGKLNKLLPKRQFLLMGPGRWGSRGDIKLGVNVTYSEINNSAMLIEIARKKGNYVPDLSFGTHFFQDLVESGIRYLPLYPDDEGIVFNEVFLKNSKNILSEVLPDYARLAETIRLIDVPQSTSGKVLQVLMNSDLEEAMGILAEPLSQYESPVIRIEGKDHHKDDFWRWRTKMIECLAANFDMDKYGVVGLYLIGSTKNATAGPASDIDILVHFRGTPSQMKALQHYFEGCGNCLSEVNYLRTGYRTKNILDAHIITDEDIMRRTSFAAKIGAVTDAARPLKLKKDLPS
ncbi:MAG: pyruvate, phosphate dikinase [candidate division Zixibacteria bacterium HGW-Zixibacteria-1]|nr:MAG: pyruvate, phosphate dikinase [candidate division Zixibacteria bacterium HGW-Zixibacteria-1]